MIREKKNNYLKYSSKINTVYKNSTIAIIILEDSVDIKCILLIPAEF